MVAFLLRRELSQAPAVRIFLAADRRHLRVELLRCAVPPPERFQHAVALIGDARESPFDRQPLGLACGGEARVRVLRGKFIEDAAGVPEEAFYIGPHQRFDEVATNRLRRAAALDLAAVRDLTVAAIPDDAPARRPRVVQVADAAAHHGAQ